MGQLHEHACALCVNSISQFAVSRDHRVIEVDQWNDGQHAAGGMHAGGSGDAHGDPALRLAGVKRDLLLTDQATLVVVWVVTRADDAIAQFKRPEIDGSQNVLEIAAHEPVSFFKRFEVGELPVLAVQYPLAYETASQGAAPSAIRLAIPAGREQRNRISQ